MSCTRAGRRLLQARDSGVSLAERLALDEHLARCADCRALDALDASLDQALALTPEPPTAQLDIEARVRSVRAAIDERARFAAVRRVHQRRVLVAAAALLAVAALVFTLARNTGERSLSVDDAGTLVATPVTPPSAERSRAPAPEQELDEEPPLDLARLEGARNRARAALVAAAGQPLPRVERLALLDLELQGLLGEGWPVARLIERSLGDEDADVAALAVHWLGSAGDRLALGPIAGLVRDERRDSALRAQALEVLLAQGTPPRATLLAILDEPELRPLALAALVEQGDDQLAADLGRALRAGAGGEHARDLDLCAALVHLGDAGIDELVRLAAQPDAPSTGRIALATLDQSEVALARLSAQLDQRAGQTQRGERLRVAARLGLANALGHLLDAAFERRERREALASLGEFRGPGAWSVLVDLWVSGRVPPEELLAAARLRLGVEGFEVSDAIARAASRGDRAGLDAQLDLLLQSESPAAAPALLQLAGCRLLESDQRQWAVLALIQLGGDEQVESLTNLLRELSPIDLRLAAACALALHALGGPDAVADALGPAALERSEDLVALFVARSTNRNRSVTLSRASRLVEPWLELTHPERPRTDL